MRETHTKQKSMHSPVKHWHNTEERSKSQDCLSGSLLVISP